ncbi:Exosome complex exonuclease RRP44-like protein A [Diplonema papillatum]|nr:Exosome complex exonuclease RRP44-like protein A [Diplonema papillatum]
MFRGSKSYFSSSKKGGKLTVTRQVKKIYLRTDIACGSEACAVCGALLKEMTGVATLDANAKVLLIPDTNVFLHNIDAMESPAIADVVVLDTVLAEVKNLNKSVYERLARVVRDPEKKKRFYVFSNENHRDTAAEQEPGESANDHNDKLIRNAAKWYQLHLSQVENGPEVVLLTHDIGNKEKAVKAGIRALSVAEYVTEYKREDASLLEMVVTATGATVERRGAGSNIYEPHLSAAEADAAVRTGAVLKGPLRAGNVHEGTVRVASEKVDDETGKTTKVFAEYLIASKKDMNRAIDGDAVGVVPYPVRQWTKPSRFLRKGEKDTGDGSRITANTDDADEARLGGFIPTARVVALIENNRRPVCGSIMWNEDQSSSTATERVLFRPIKSNFPHVSLQTRQAAQWAGKRLQVVIDDWNINMNYPDGHCVKVLGDIGDKDVEAEVILLENDVPHYEFSNKVIACLPTGKWQVEPDQLKVRRDFRDRTVVSVDPPGCKDIDDALHCHRLPNGNLEVGVHIADVTHFVKEASPLDDEASKRSTSVYLVDRRIDMLPKLLTENLCSLVGGEDRYTFSVVWEVTPDCEVVNTTYTKGMRTTRISRTTTKARAILFLTLLWGLGGWKTVLNLSFTHGWHHLRT